MLRTLMIRTFAMFAAAIFNGGLDVDHTQRDSIQTEGGSFSKSQERKKVASRNCEGLLAVSSRLYCWDGRTFKQTEPTA